MTARDTRDPARQAGLALIAVLIALSVMLALLGPFLLSMGQTDRVAYHGLNQLEARNVVEGARGVALQRVAGTHGTLDPTAGVDSLGEFPARLSVGETGGPSLETERIATGEVGDLQGRLHVPTAPMLVWANLLGLKTVLAKDLDPDEEDLIEASGIDRFPDEGYVWIDHELIHYGRKGDRGFENLTRQVDWPGGGSPPDPHGRAAKHLTGTMFFDARIRLLMTAQFDEGRQDRSRFFPWRSLEELPRISRYKRGELTMEELEPLRPLLSFDAARPHGAALGKAERVMNRIEGGLTFQLEVKDGASFPAGGIIRVKVKDAHEWALVIAHSGRGGRRSTIDGSRMFLHLHRTLSLSAEEGEAVIEPLQPVPVNVNTADARVLAATLEGVRRPPGSSGPQGHRLMRTPLSRSKAKQLAERFVAGRGEDADAPRPYDGFEDLVTRAIQPMIDEEGLMTKRELEYVYLALMNGRHAKLDHCTIPIVFESSGLVRYRVAGALQSPAGNTLAMRELRGIAYPQPAHGVDRVYASQVDFDEASRLDRSRPYMHTWPKNTTMRFAGSGEPPDLSAAHLLPYFHGKAGEFPTKEPEEGRVTLAISRAPRWRGNGPAHDFESSSDPEGWNATKQGVYKDVQAFLGAAAKSGRARQQQARDMQRSRAIPMYEGDRGKGIAFGFSAWFKPESLGNQTLFDLASTAAPIQNRIFLAVEDNQLVLRLFDTAGLDPMPDVFNPTETCCKWTVPLAGNGIEADLWTHVAFEICGGTADGLVLFTDGAAKGKPWYVSYLGGEIPAQDLSAANPNPGRPDPRLHPAVVLEDTEGWPRQGVAIVGNELIEYTEVTSGGLLTVRKNSRGRRAARQDLLEFRTGQGNNVQLQLPQHPANSGVRLYGYSNPLLEDYVIVPGEGRVSAGGLDPWGVARVTTAKEDITFALGQGSITFGRGITDRYAGPLDVAPPLVNSKPGEKGVPGFDKDGGYALLVQIGWTGGWRVSGVGQVDFAVGGVELIRYRSFDGKQLNGIERGVSDVGSLAGGQASIFTGKASNFVAEWRRGGILDVNGKGIPDPENWPQLFIFCVPVSMRVQGLTMPQVSQRGHAEWLQTMPRGTEEHTEWTRYDHVEGDMAMRTNLQAVQRLFRVLTDSDTITNQDLVGDNAPLPGRGLSAPIVWAEVPAGPPDEIGTPSQDELPASYAARREFRFRGDPEVGTATHAQGGDSVVTHVFRTLLVEGDVKLGRPGRGDRVALVSGSSASNPLVDWQSVNWSARNWEIFNNGNQGGGSGGGNREPSRPSPPGPGGQNRVAPDRAGPRCNLVGLKAGPSAPFFGKKIDLRTDDVRDFDRVVKFPSGELPQLLSQPLVGGSSHGDLPEFRGKLDDVQGYWSMTPNQRSGGTGREIVGRVMIPCSETDQEITIIAGDHVRQGTGALRGGGLLLIEGEIAGFTEIDQVLGLMHRVRLAANGRGLLGTQARAHDIGARVQFVSCRPATYLTSQIAATQAGFMVAQPDKLPEERGTVLCGEELMHYAWRRGPLFEMPPHTVANQGLFRGRYGTTPAGHANGEMVISWPIRFWDRYDLRADDPELAYFGVSAEAPSLFVTEVGWEEEIPEATMDLVLLARADERVPWSADPETTFGLWMLDDPANEDGQFGRKIGAQAARWDFRFCVRYLTGAFNPQLFNGTGWKRTPVVKNFIWSYQAATHILAEEVRLR